MDATLEPEVSAVPIAPTNLDPSVIKAVIEATGTLFEKALTTGSGLVKGAHTPTPMPVPQSWFADPYSQVDAQGQGYITNPGHLTYEMLRMISERSTIASAIILTRIHQVLRFLQEQPNKYSVGYKLLPIGADPRHRLSDGEKDRVRKIKAFITHMGAEHDPDGEERDDLMTFGAKFVRDRLTYDQACFQKVWCYGGLHSIYMMDSATIRHSVPVSERGWMAEAGGDEVIRYAQVVNGEIAAEYTRREMAFCIANPRTAIRVAGYGFPELEMLVTTITSHLWAEEWNRRAFSQGSTTKGVLNLKGNIPPLQLEAFKRMWLAQVSGVQNAWRTPVINAEGGIEWIPTQMDNQEMGYMQWMEYLIKIFSAIYLIDPSEINFDLRGGMNSQPAFMTQNDAQQKLSRDRGLGPLLTFTANALNRHIIWNIDPGFEIRLLGLDAKTEEQAMDLRQKQVSTIYTINEARAMEDLPPIKNGDVVPNPAFLGFVQQKAQMDQQQQMQQVQAMQGGGPGGPAGGPGGGGAAPFPQGGFSGGPPGPEEQQAAGRLKEAAEGGENEKSSDEEEPKDIAELHMNDWASTVHSSIDLGDLRKALESRRIYVTLADGDY